MGACCVTTKHMHDLNITNIAVAISNKSASDITSESSAHDLRQQKTSNKEIEKQMKSLEKEQGSIIKTLLLGAGSSGKSTLFRQIENIHGEEKENGTIHGMERFFIDSDTITKTIRLNTINGLIKLLKQSQILCQEPYNINKCMVDDKDPDIDDAVKMLVETNKISEYGTVAYYNYNAQDMENLGKAMQLLWELEAIQETFNHRQYFSLEENINYFLDKITIIMDDSDSNGYVPSFDDILNARMRTTGIVERSYFIQNTHFNMFDVGGQRNERRKWISLFDNVNVVIFVAALNHYCSVLFEDEAVNAMHESIKLFDETVNSKWFSSGDTQWILFLNKNDLFINRLKMDKISIKECFPEYNGNNYNDRNENQFENEMQKKEWFDLCYKECVTFITNKYLEKIQNVQARKNVRVHVTVATEKTNIETVFVDVIYGIMRRNLAESNYM